MRIGMWPRAAPLHLPTKGQENACSVTKDCVERNCDNVSDSQETNISDSQLQGTEMSGTQKLQQQSNAVLDSQETVMSDSQETVMSGSQETVMSDSQETVMSDSQETVMSDSQETVMSDSQETVMSDSQETVMSDSQETVMSDSQETVISDSQSILRSIPGNSEPSCSSQAATSCSDETISKPSTEPTVLIEEDESSNNSQSLLPSRHLSDDKSVVDTAQIVSCDSLPKVLLNSVVEVESVSEDSQSLLQPQGAKASLSLASNAIDIGVNSLYTLQAQGNSDDTQNCSLLQPNKKRKVQMDTQQCMDHMHSQSGAQVLVNPAAVTFSSKDPNRGFYPRRNLSKSFGSGFVPASSLNQVKLVEPLSQPDQSKQQLDFPASYTSYGTKKKAVPDTTNNSILNYFSKSDKKPIGSSGDKGYSHQSETGCQGDASAAFQTKAESPAGGDNAFTTLLAGAGRKTQGSNSTKRSSRGKAKKPAGSLSSSQKTSASVFSWKQSSFGTDTIDLTEDGSSDDSLDAALSESNAYGLVGDEMKNYKSPTNAKRETRVLSRAEDMDYFSILPVHVIENIFSQLPMLDLCLNSNRVCLMWNDIISDEKFVPWKKLYHKLKKNVGETKKEVEDLMNENGMAHPTDFLEGLIRYMKDFKPTTAKNMTSCLKKHPKYFWAEDLIKERIQECIINEELNPWCVVAVLVTLSEDVCDIQNIIRNLLAPLSQCTAIEVLECLYCIATFLFAFTLVRRHAVWHGMHYRVYYALYLHENSSITSIGQLQNAFTNYKGQQTIVRYQNAMSGIRMTHEQLRIVNHNVLPGQIIKIVAFAGTGKTTTLVRYTQLRPSLRFLLVVFNKAVQIHAKTQFPANVECRTSHSLAFRAFGRKYQAAKKLNTYALKVFSVAMNLPKREEGGNSFIRGKFALDTLQTFMASADDFVTSAHAPHEKMDEKVGCKIPLTHAEKMNYAKDAEYLWKKMVDLDDKTIRMTHDGYLKLYQLSKPKLYEYDCILVDEAQDLTPAVADIFLSQTQAKILVGDPRQQIYSFRGAVNAMVQVEATKIFYLTQSFRFGPEIAYVANCCMDTLHGEKQRTLVGNGIPGGVKGDTVGQIAIIARTNFHLFGEAVKRCCHCPEPIKAAFIGGTDNFGFDMILDIHTLLLPLDQRREIKNNFIQRFASFFELEKYAEKTLDSELLGKIKIAKCYQSNLPTLIQKIKTRCIRDPDLADYIFTTAHKAKGLEFSTVQLTDDYVGLPHGSIMSQIMSVSQDEGNLLYVAVTRAKKRLLLTDTLLALLKLCGEKFDYPKHTSLVKEDDKPLKSFQTDTEITPGPICLVRSDIKKSNAVTISGGVWNPELIKQDHLEFAGLLGELQVEVKSLEYH
ncbi:F-box DNA helicase 1-like [Lineus longissimus]|uniref:F-box DNA helicase 1-like n=1 Tax=Lineus longissimus TaxID=88925 RepID=UPI002B4EEA20